VYHTAMGDRHSAARGSRRESGPDRAVHHGYSPAAAARGTGRIWCCGQPRR